MIWCRDYGNPDINEMKDYSSEYLNGVICAEYLCRISALELHGIAACIAAYISIFLQGGGTQWQRLQFCSNLTSSGA